MEDIGMNSQDSRNNIQEPVVEMCDGKAKNVCGQEDPDKLINETNDNSSVISDMESQIKIKIEAEEPTNEEHSVGEQINTGTMTGNEELICNKRNAAEQTAVKTAAEEKGDATNEMVAENPSTNQCKLAANEAPQSQDKDEEMNDVTKTNDKIQVKDELKEQSEEIVATAVETTAKHTSDVAAFPNQQEPVTPNSNVKLSPATSGDRSGDTAKTILAQTALPLLAVSDDGTPEEQAAFLREVENFYHEKAVDFKAPKFYGQPLNCLKLWRSVIKMGGYDRVTGAKLWRLVGESFHPPKTCTTVSWTFRIFYEKSLLEYERHKTQIGELQFPTAILPGVSGAGGEISTVGDGYQGSGSGRARRDAAARAMQGWHTKGLLGHGEVGEPVLKDKNRDNVAKLEKNLKSIGSMKQRRLNEMEHLTKAARTETSKQSVASVVDIGPGPPADWVKINIRQTKDCFEVYALVPGLFREEVRVQSDPAGRIAITGEPEQVDNPWGITPFKKIVSLPGRIDPLQTSAVVSLHGRLFVRVPFEQSNT